MKKLLLVLVAVVSLGIVGAVMADQASAFSFPGLGIGGESKSCAPTYGCAVPYCAPMYYCGPYYCPPMCAPAPCTKPKKKKAAK